MRRLAIAAFLLAGCGGNGHGADHYDNFDPISLDEGVKLEVRTEVLPTGMPRFVVDLSALDGNDCLVTADSFGGTFRGAVMEVLQVGGRVKGSCRLPQLAIPFEQVVPANDTIEVHDENGSLKATYAPDILEIRAATSDWTFQAGTTTTLTWSHPIVGTPRMSFANPTYDGRYPWHPPLMGTASGRTISFTLPAQLSFGGVGKVMISVDGARGITTSCTSGRCTYALDYFVIHDATVNP